MKQAYSKSWKSSARTEKQRKYAFNAPFHTKAKFLASPLSKDLKKKHSKNALRVRSGDKVKILRGQFKGKEGKIEKVDLQRTKIYVEKIETIKKDGTKTQYPIHPSNIMIIELNLDDKKRLKSRDASASKVPKQEKKAPAKKEEKEVAKPAKKESPKKEEKKED